jgi:hypothetical protein
VSLPCALREGRGFESLAAQEMCGGGILLRGFSEWLWSAAPFDPWHGLRQLCNDGGNSRNNERRNGLMHNLKV